MESIYTKLYLKCPWGNFVGKSGRRPEVRILSVTPDHDPDPSVTFTHIVSGIARNVDTSKIRVVLWAGGYVQPYRNRPYTGICFDGSWATSTRRFYELTAILVEETYSYEEVGKPHDLAGTPGVLAWDVYPKKGGEQQ